LYPFYTDSFLRFSSIIIFLNCILSTQIGILNGFQSFKKIAVINLYGSLLAIPLQVYFTWLYQINGFIFASAVSCLIQALFNHMLIRKHLSSFSVKVSLTKDLKFSFINFCIPAALSGLLVTPVSWYCNTILVKSENGFHEMAFFDIANNWRMILIFIPATISQVVLPKLSSMQNRAQLQKFLYFNIAINGGVALMLSLTLVVCSVPLLKLYGLHYVGGNFTLKILTLSSIFLAVGNVVGQLIAGKLKMWYGFVVNLIWAVVIIFLSSYLIRARHMGAEGLAWAYLFSYFIHTFLQLVIFFFYFKKTKTSNA
jgi:O-antigen/teichoic acid export membrane protein